MLFTTLHLTAVLLFLFGDRLAAAIPTATTDTLERRIDPDNISMYSVDFFVKAALNKPASGTCLFYTRGLTEKAQQFALEQNLFTIWDIWDGAFYNRSQAVTNPLREILKFNPLGKNAPDAQIYFTNMSKAYPMLCDVYALVMTEDPENVIEDGIWGQVEKPTLQQTGNPGGQVNLIDACDVDGTNITKPAYWSRERDGGQKNIAVALPDTTVAASSALTSSSYSSAMSSIGTSYISSSAASSPAMSSSLMADVRRRQKFPLTVLPHSSYTPEELSWMFVDIDLLW